MDIPIIHTITVIAPTLTATFPFIMIRMGFIISVVVTTRLAIGEEDTDPCSLNGDNKGTAFLAPTFTVPKQNRILTRWRHLDEMIKSHASGYIHCYPAARNGIGSAALTDRGIREKYKE